MECINEILIQDECNDINQLENDIERVNELCSKMVDMKVISMNVCWNKEIQFWYERKRIDLCEFNRCICRECKLVYSRMNAKLKKAIRRAKSKSWREYVAQMSHRSTTKNVWDVFNRVRGENGNARNVVLGDREKGNEFIRMILNVENGLNDGDIREMDEGIENEMNGSRIDEFEWDKFLRVLAKAKSTTPGTNRVSYIMIQMLSDEAKQNLPLLLNKAWMETEYRINGRNVE